MRTRAVFMFCVQERVAQRNVPIFGITSKFDLSVVVLGPKSIHMFLEV